MGDRAAMPDLQHPPNGGWETALQHLRFPDSGSHEETGIAREPSSRETPCGGTVSGRTQVLDPIAEQAGPLGRSAAAPKEAGRGSG